MDVIAAVNYLKAVDENRLVRMHLRIGENLVERHEKVVHRGALGDDARELLLGLILTVKEVRTGSCLGVHLEAL